jgi:hypothetical protein
VKHWFTYPLITHPYNPEFMSRDGVVRLARAAEAAGFAGTGFTDHPAPSHKWLSAGGHDALPDPGTDYTTPIGSYGLRRGRSWRRPARPIDIAVTPAQILSNRGSRHRIDSGSPPRRKNAIAIKAATPTKNRKNAKRRR